MIEQIALGLGDENDVEPAVAGIGARRPPAITTRSVGRLNVAARHRSWDGQ